MSIAENQQRTLRRLLEHLRLHWHHDAALPARIQALLGSQRQFGSRDRRLYRELIYTTLRYLPSIEPLLETEPGEAVRRIAWLAADTPATQSFRAALAVGPKPIPEPASVVPAWFRAHCPELFDPAELAAQARRSPVWLRLQGPGSEDVLAEFDARGWQWRPAPAVNGAIELVSEADVTRTDSWRRGACEVQDLGSQMILEAIGIEPGGVWLDACAGAGGKTLQLAWMLGAAGRIHAHDVRAAALRELEERAARAGLACLRTGGGATGGPATRGVPRLARPAINAATIEVTLQVPERHYDGVLVDAPCSGSGTWRRAPHLKWLTTPARIEEEAERQRALLAKFAARVAPGGRLVYATCSLSSRENEDVVAAFLAGHADFRPEPVARPFDTVPRGAAGRLVLPSRHDTDGFFFASLRRQRAPAPA